MLKINIFLEYLEVGYYQYSLEIDLVLVTAVKFSLFLLEFSLNILSCFHLFLSS